MIPHRQLIGKMISLWCVPHNLLTMLSLPLLLLLLLLLPSSCFSSTFFRSNYNLAEPNWTNRKSIKRIYDFALDYRLSTLLSQRFQFSCYSHMGNLNSLMTLQSYSNIILNETWNLSKKFSSCHLLWSLPYEWSCDTHTHAHKMTGELKKRIMWKSEGSMPIEPKPTRNTH